MPGRGILRIGFNSPVKNLDFVGDEVTSLKFSWFSRPVNTNYDKLE
jgi:hypothetical protein